MKIGILGGSQLSKMLLEAASQLNHSCIIYDPSDNCCTKKLCTHFIHDFKDLLKLKEFAEEVDVITYESENIPVETVHYLSKIKPVHPGVDALILSSDKWKQKKFFDSLNIPAAKSINVTTFEELQLAASGMMFPIILKSRTAENNNKPPLIIYSLDQLRTGWGDFVNKSIIVEELIEYDREVSIIAARTYEGFTVFQDLCENYYKNGTLQYSVNKPNDSISAEARIISEKMLNKLNFRGTLTVEFFQKDNKLIVKKCSSFVHNSGHWTIEGANVSQFENHIRAITGMALIEPKSTYETVMINLIGKYPEHFPVLPDKSVNLHSYGISPGQDKKLGHVTVYSKTKVDPSRIINLLKTS